MRFARSKLMWAVLATAASISTASAQSNEIYLLQDSQASSDFGNELFIDQRQASGSTVGTRLQPALQQGGGNVARVSLVDEAELAEVLLEQSGDGNEGLIEIIGGFGNVAELVQFGDNNLGTVRVNGTENRGRLEQVGDDNTYILDFTTGSLAGSTGTVVEVFQNGNGLTTPGVQVFTNAPGTITITQTN